MAARGSGPNHPEFELRNRNGMACTLGESRVQAEWHLPDFEPTAAPEELDEEFNVLAVRGVGQRRHG